MSLANAQNAPFKLEADTARALANEFGTPLYVIDEASLRAKARLFVSSWPGDVSFASKANTTLAVLRIVYEEGCSIDVASAGELRGALKAGVPAKACRLHGNNKSQEEIDFAVSVGVGKIVVDCFEEIERLKDVANLPPLLIRLAPGVNPKTNAKISTGQADTKFGFPLSDAERAVKACLDYGLPVIGFHCHVGSQLLDSEAQVGGAEALANIALDLKKSLGFETKFINVGGGLGVRYSVNDRPTGVAEYCQQIQSAIRAALRGELDPELGMEPGRSIIAESGVTLYSVGVVKTAATGRVYVAVDGGLSDNPRPALYGSKYEVFWPGKDQEPTQTVTVSGKHCETDTLFPDIEAPYSVRAGDLVQVLSTGAYNSSMASNYNGFRRPATALLRADGSATLIQRRETWEELHQRDIVPEGL